MGVDRVGLDRSAVRYSAIASSSLPCVSQGICRGRCGRAGKSGLRRSASEFGDRLVKFSLIVKDTAEVEVGVAQGSPRGRALRNSAIASSSFPFLAKACPR